MAQATPKILLVMPSSDRCVRSLFRFHEGEGLGAKPPLGLLSIASTLRASGFPNVSILDANREGLNIEQTAQRIVAATPDVVGLSAMTDMWFGVHRVLARVREQLPEALLVVGGPHVTIYPELSLQHSEADWAVAGDGEHALCEALRAREQGRVPDDIAGVFIKTAKSKIKGPGTRLAMLEDLDSLPVPDRGLLDGSYDALLGEGRGTTMITSRGCPYRCVFCKLHVQKVQSRSAELVVQEFEQAAQLGFAEVEVYDDTFTWSRERAVAICEGLIKARNPLRWSVRSRVNRVDEDLLRLMKQAGCQRIHLGIESGNPEVLAASKKGITLEQAHEAADAAKRAGLEVLAYYMVGFLDETRQQAEDTLRFAMALDTDYVAFAVLIPYPGTEIYQQALRRKILPNDFWEAYARAPTPDFELPAVIEQHISRDGLVRFVDRAHFRFYWRPRRVLRELLSVRSLGGLRRRANMALNLLRHRISHHG